MGHASPSEGLTRTGSRIALSQCELKDDQLFILGFFKEPLKSLCDFYMSGI